MPKTIDPSKLQLGRKPGVIHDARTLRMASYLTPAELPALPLRTRTGAGLTWNMLGNDRYGDCTYAAKVHLEHSVARTTTEPSAQKVIDAYLRFTGGADDGAYILDVLNAWRRADDGVSGQISAFAALDLSDRRLIHAACWLFGGLYLGAALPISAQAQTGTKWWASGDGTGDSAPGSWGGHAMYVCASYGQTNEDLEVVTWGARQRLTWKWFERYCDECFACIHRDWLARHNGRTPQGFDEEALLADLREIAHG